MNPSYGDVLDATARAVSPSDPAIVCDDRVTSWAAFDAASNALARALLTRLEPGAKVAQYMTNSPEYLIGFAAALKARLVPVNVNYRYGPEELHYLFDNCDAEAILFDAGFSANVRALKARLPEVKVWASVGGGDGGGAAEGFESFDSLSTGDPSPLGIVRSPDDLFLLYTGGTTGLPKGVMWPGGTWWQVLSAGRAPVLGEEPPMTLDALAAQIRTGRGREPVYVPTPLMHGTGLFTAMGALTKGAPVVLTRRSSFDPKAALDTATKLRCGGFVVVGDAFARPLLDALRAEPARYDVTCLRIVTSSGMMWSPEVKMGLLEFMPDAVLLDSFGSSEGTGLGISLTSRNVPAAEARFEAPDTRVVRESDFTRVTPGSGEVGLVAKQGNLPLGYYKDPEKTARTYVMIDGQRHLLSGDHATVESDGSIRLLGRGNHCINSAGEKIYPEEVEEALKTHPAVRDALVFGVADPRFGQLVAAVVELIDDGAASDAELVAHVRDKLAAYKAPRRIAIVPRVPRAPNGKADYDGAKAAFVDT